LAAASMAFGLLWFPGKSSGSSKKKTSVKELRVLEQRIEDFEFYQNENT
jgi:hypothetical protein